ncbi:MAG: glutamate decarboxylase, partial [Alistipes sp.]|nr:glutamate decarboxylase [Alistipes sp.]
MKTSTKAKCSTNAKCATTADGRLVAAPTEFIPQSPTSPEVAYKMVKDETYPQTQPRLNLATFVT